MGASSWQMTGFKVQQQGPKQTLRASSIWGTVQTGVRLKRKEKKKKEKGREEKNLGFLLNRRSR